jgi:exopolysaccharide production protein ExoQ
MMARFFDEWLPACVLVLLPVFGTMAGPAYAPIVFALGVARFLHRWTFERHAPRLDPAWSAVAAAVVGLCWLSWAWSMAPERTLHGAAQVTVVLFAGLVVLAQAPLTPAAAPRLTAAMAIAFLAGGVVLALDATAGWPLQRWLSGGAANADAKYNRGVAYALLLAWPLLGRLWCERARGFALCLLLGLGLMLGFGVGLTPRLAAAASFAVFALALLLPRRIGPLLMLASAAFAATAPLLLRALSQARAILAPHLKQSGEARLEIWNYMTARVLERPWLGHGFWSANWLRPTPAELRGYAWVTMQGVYPHDQWLQAWVELGALGAALAIAASLLALTRARRLAAQLQPFAYAAFAAVVTLSLADFDLATDSWWAAIALCAWLFRAAPAGEREA